MKDPGSDAFRCPTEFVECSKDTDCLQCVADLMEPPEDCDDDALNHAATSCRAENGATECCVYARRQEHCLEKNELLRTLVGK